jgi:hypothetical protein
MWLDGEHLRAAVLRPLRGEDELFLSTLVAPLPERVTLLLAHCLTALSTLSPVPASLVAALPIGDREALLLKLRSLSYGGRMAAVLNCSHCGAKLDLDLTADQLLVAPYAQPAPIYELVQDGMKIAFRLPNGEDEAIVAGLPLEQGEGELLRRCLVQVTPEGQDLPATVIEAINQAMLDCDPQAELLIDMQCPECGQAFTALFDSAQYFLREIDQRAGQLYREIHVLALAYHWSEAEILALPYQRRQMYLSLLDEEGVR